MKKENKEKIMNVRKLIILLALFSIMLIILWGIDYMYPANLLDLIIWYWLVPLVIFMLSFFLLGIFYKKSNQFNSLFHMFYYLLPLGFIYEIATQFYHRSQHVWQNMVLDYGILMVFLLLYLVVGQELFVLLNRNKKEKK